MPVGGRAAGRKMSTAERNGRPEKAGSGELGRSPVDAAVEEEKRVDLLADRADRRIADARAVQREHVALGPWLPHSSLYLSTSPGRGAPLSGRAPRSHPNRAAGSGGRCGRTARSSSAASRYRAAEPRTRSGCPCPPARGRSLPLSPRVSLATGALPVPRPVAASTGQTSSARTRAAPCSAEQERPARDGDRPGLGHDVVGRGLAGEELVVLDERLGRRRDLDVGLVRDGHVRRARPSCGRGCRGRPKPRAWAAGGARLSRRC